MSTVSATQSVTVDVPRDAFFEWWVPIELSEVVDSYGPIPGVSRTSGRTGPWDVVGSQRTVHFDDGSRAREEVVSCEPPQHFAYRVDRFTGAFRYLVDEARGEWTFRRNGAATDVTWTFTFRARSPLAIPLLVPAVKLLYRGYMERAIEATRALAERELGSG